MMRLTMAIWWGLGLFWLLTSYLGAQPKTGQPPHVLKQPALVSGYGETEAEARKEAARHLAETLQAFLQKQEPALVAWKPSPEYVNKHLLEERGAPGQEIVVDGLGPRQTWEFSVKPLDMKWAKLLDDAAQRRAREEQRVGLSFQVLACVAAALGLVWLAASFRSISPLSRLHYRHAIGKRPHPHSADPAGGRPRLG